MILLFMMLIRRCCRRLFSTHNENAATYALLSYVSQKNRYTTWRSGVDYCTVWIDLLVSLYSWIVLRSGHADVVISCETATKRDVRCCEPQIYIFILTGGGLLDRSLTRGLAPHTCLFLTRERRYGSRMLFSSWPE